MRYMQTGGFQNNPYMRLTLGLTLLLLLAFTATNFMLYFAKMDLSPASVVSYYNGNEEEFRPARTYQSMLEVTHGHLAMMAIVMLLLTHLVVFAPMTRGWKIGVIVTAFLSALGSEGAAWLVRFVHPGFAWLKVLSFLLLQATLVFLLGTLAAFLWSAWRRQKQLESVLLGAETEEEIAEEEAHLP
ncbi:MAG: hypothetical protein HRF44_11420 [Ignavibacterium sp.]|jgi:hypothetical protein